LAVTPHPTAEWTAHQLLQAFPWDTAPRYLLRDRDGIFGSEFVQQLKVMDIEQALSAPAHLGGATAQTGTGRLRIDQFSFQLRPPWSGSKVLIARITSGNSPSLVQPHCIENGQKSLSVALARCACNAQIDIPFAHS